jgi:dephospho-CoA kinase
MINPGSEDGAWGGCRATACLRLTVRVLTIGLTGGIGAGKSAVAARLAEHGAVVIDADQIAREVVAPGTDGLREVVAAFGTDVLRPDGALDRPALGTRVFGDDAARRRLEGIVHPRVRARTAELAAAAPPDAVVVNDVPLLVEAGLAPTYHLVIVVDAPEQVRVDRLVRTRGMPADEAVARMRAQATDAQRRAVADVLVPNAGSPADLHARVDALWERLRTGRPARPPWMAAHQDGDAQWPARFARLAARLRHAAGDLVTGVDPVGPAAMSGAPPGGVPDIEVTVARPEDAERLRPLLATAGFPAEPAPPATTPADGRPVCWHGSADPGEPVRVRLRVAAVPPPAGRT